MTLLDVYDAQGTKDVNTVLFAYEFEQMSAANLGNLPAYHRSQFYGLVTMYNDSRTSPQPKIQDGYAITMALERVRNTKYSATQHDNWSYLVYQYDLLIP